MNKYVVPLHSSNMHNDTTVLTSSRVADGAYEIMIEQISKEMLASNGQFLQQFQVKKLSHFGVPEGSGPQILLSRQDV